MQGVWVSRAYLAALERTRSAEESWDALDGTPEIFLDTHKPTHDSVKVYASANNHEGEEFWLLLRRGSQPHSLLVSRGEYDAETNQGNHWEISYEVRNHDTTLAFRCLTPNSRVKAETSYSRARRHMGRLYEESEVTNAARRILFAGKYEVLYPDAAATKATLATDGSVAGLGIYRYFVPQTDFMTPPFGDNIDLKPNPATFDSAKVLTCTVRWHGDTLLLHRAYVKEPADGSGEPPTHEPGPLQFRLLRRRSAP